MRKIYKIFSIEQLDENHIMFNVKKHRCPNCRKSKPVCGMKMPFFFSDDNGKTCAGQLVCKDCKIVFNDNKYQNKLIIIKRLSKNNLNI